MVKFIVIISMIFILILNGFFQAGWFSYDILTLFNIGNKELETRNRIYNKVHATIDNLLEKNQIQTKFYDDRQSLVIDYKNEKKCKGILANFNNSLKEKYGVKIKYFGK